MQTIGFSLPIGLYSVGNIQKDQKHSIVFQAAAVNFLAKVLIILGISHDNFIPFIFGNKTEREYCNYTKRMVDNLS